MVVNEVRGLQEKIALALFYPLPGVLITFHLFTFNPTILGLGEQNPETPLHWPDICQTTVNDRSLTTGLENDPSHNNGVCQMWDCLSDVGQSANWLALALPVGSSSIFLSSQIAGISLSLSLLMKENP